MQTSIRRQNEEAEIGALILSEKEMVQMRHTLKKWDGISLPQHFNVTTQELLK